jgi:hypothetical protein
LAYEIKIEETLNLPNEQHNEWNRTFVKGFVIIIAIAGSGYVGLSDIASIQKKHDVSGLFYENITRMFLVIAITMNDLRSVLYISRNYYV